MIIKRKFSFFYEVLLSTQHYSCQRHPEHQMPNFMRKSLLATSHPSSLVSFTSQYGFLRSPIGRTTGLGRVRYDRIRATGSEQDEEEEERLKERRPTCSLRLSLNPASSALAVVAAHCDEKMREEEDRSHVLEPGYYGQIIYKEITIYNFLLLFTIFKNSKLFSFSLYFLSSPPSSLFS